jgi:hypothetical protein
MPGISSPEDAQIHSAPGDKLRAPQATASFIDLSARDHRRNALQEQLMRLALTSNPLRMPSSARPATTRVP